MEKKRKTTADRWHTLVHLRKHCEQMSRFRFKGSPQKLSKQIQDQMEDICFEMHRLKLLSEEEKSKKEHEYDTLHAGDLYRQARLKNGYTQEQIAKLIGCTHAMIHHQEQKIGLKTLDLFYLEAFSLIYQITPKALLNLEKKQIQPALLSRENDLCRCQDLVLSSLHDPERIRKADYLQSVFILTQMNAPAYDQLAELFKLVPALNEILTVAYENHPLYGDVSHAKKDLCSDKLPHPGITDEDFLLLYAEAFQGLEHMIDTHSPWLSFIARYAAAPHQISTLLMDILTIGRFPLHAQSLIPPASKEK